jgi:2-polyprenyl-6-methoxyphenol hydroxylase-like FAD-dependent oxidoreductase
METDHDDQMLPGHDAHPKVLVVGAGPTGLLLAAELERRAVPCMLIDELNAPRGWDRATVVHERSLEIFEALGIVDSLISDGVRTRGARLHSDGAAIAEVNLELTHSRYGYQLGVSEEVTEAVLTRFLEDRGGHVTRSTRLVGLAMDGEEVVATLEQSGQTRSVTVAWVVGCDGYRSTVREMVGIDYPGTDIEAPWAVFDARLDGWHEDYDMVSVHLDVPPVILTPLPFRRWRVYVRPSSDTSDLVAEATGVLRNYAPEIRFVEVTSPARFRCHSRVAAQYRAGRVLLAGDAAHACTPAEGHGMNTGLQDAFNLGWKLAMVCRGEAGDGLLDTYEAERRPVAERVVASGTDTESAQALSDPTERAARDASIRRLLADPEQAHHEAAADAEIDRSYPRSQAVAGDETPGLRPGILLPDTEPVQPADGPPRALHELAQHPGYTVFVLGGPRADPAQVAALVTKFTVRSWEIVDTVVGLSTAPGAHPTGGLPPSVAAQLNITDVTVLAVRPDRYIGLRDDSGSGELVAAYFENLAG